MRTVELLEHAYRAARTLKYEIRHEWLGESEGGVCEFGGRKWLFIDVTENASEQLERVVLALRSDPRVADLKLVRPLRALLDAGTPSPFGASPARTGREKRNAA